MNTIDINFASVPFRNNTPYWLGYGLGALGLAAFITFNSWAFFAYSESRAVLESDHAAKKARLEELYQDTVKLQGLIKKEDIEAINSRASYTNSLLEKRRFSWTDLLNSLEEVQPYQVRLLSLLPRIQERGILIDSRAVAKDLQAFWNFQQNLQNHPKFRRVYPGGYQRLEETDEYVFNVQFNYFPGGAPVDVQGIGPDQFKIVQAPGAVEEGAIEEEIVEEPPPPEPSPDPAPHRSRGAGPDAAGSKRPGELAGAKPPQGAPAPPVVGSAPAPAPVVRTPPPPQPAAAAAAPGLGGTAGVAGAPQAGAGANTALNPAPGNPVIRWPARGAMPGSAGQRPPAAAKPEGLPRMPLLQPQAPSPPTEEEPEDDGESDDEGDEGGEE